MHERERPARERTRAPLPKGDVTDCLRAWSDGVPEAQDRLMSLVYAELRSLAAAYLRRERPNHSLGATALVHEAYLRLVGNTAPWRDRAHFFGVAAQAMRRILVDHARRRRASKRNPGDLQVTLDEGIGLAQRDVDLLNLDLSLRTLTALDPRQGQVVELRFFGGLSIEETAEFLAISPATVKREWATAKAFLLRELRRAPAVQAPLGP
jgi:RNA polymerase sigma factor (TIGR02999 family)